MQRSLSTSTARGAALLGLVGLSILALGCGGGASAGGGAASTQPPASQGKPAGAPQPFWDSDLPLRPAILKALHLGATPAPIISVSAEDLQALQHAVRPEARVSALAPAATSVPRIVVGLRSTTYHDAVNTTVQAMDLSTRTIQALVPNASGGFDTYPGQGHSDGTFSIPNVPSGFYLLQFGLNYLWTDSSNVNWTTSVYGRSDVAYPFTTPTNVSYTLSNLDAWQTRDSLEWDVPNQGVAFPLPLTAAPDVTHVPAVGDVALAGYTVDFAGASFNAPLLDATKNDQAYLDQLSGKLTPGGTPYIALTKVFPAPATTMTDATATAFNGGFIDLPQSSTVRGNLQLSSFGAYASAVNPSAVVSENFLGLFAYPQSPSFGVSQDAFTLLEYDNFSSSTADVDLGDLGYGNPYPAAWTPVAEAYMGFTVNYLAPGATNPYPLELGMFAINSTLPTATSPMKAAMSPVRNPLINGKSLFTTNVAVGSMPTLSWTAPALGSPTGYLVRCYELSAVGANSQIAIVGQFRTAAKTLTMPPSLLQTGHFYIFTISAISAPGANWSINPFQTALPYNTAPVMTAIVAP